MEAVAEEASPPPAANGETAAACPTPPVQRFSRLSNWRDAITNPKRKLDETGAASTSRNVKPSQLQRPTCKSTLSLNDAVRLDLPQLSSSVSAPQLHESPAAAEEPPLQPSPAAAEAVPEKAAKDADADGVEALLSPQIESSRDGLVAATVTPPQVCWDTPGPPHTVALVPVAHFACIERSIFNRRLV